MGLVIVLSMHPVERLRALARAGDLDPQLVAIEAADAIAESCEWMDDAASVTVARRLLAWHPLAAPLWYVAGRTMDAVDTAAVARDLIGELIDDPTPLMLEAALPEGAEAVGIGMAPGLREAVYGRRRVSSSTTHLLLGVHTLHSEGAIVARPALELVRQAHSVGATVWAVTGRGSVVADALWARMCALLAAGTTRPSDVSVSRAWWDDDPSDAPELEIVGIDAIDLVCCPDGLVETRDCANDPPPAPMNLLDAAGADAF